MIRNAFNINNKCFNKDMAIYNKCVQFIVADAFGDGLNYGYGSYNILLDNKEFESPTCGNYGYNETLLICDVSKYKNIRKIILILIFNINR